MSEWDEIYSAYKDFLHNSPTVQKYWAKVEAGTATYKDASAYSKLVGNNLSNIFIKQYGAEFSGVDLNDLAEDMARAVKQGYSSTAYYSKSMQASLNKKQNIGLNAIEPAFDESRAEGLKDLILSGDFSQITEETFSNITKQAVTDTVKVNAEFQQEAGLKTVMIRHAAANCCEWCNEVAGSYEYGDQPDGFWSFHKDCDCWIEYKTSKKTDKIRMYTASNGVMVKKTE